MRMFSRHGTRAAVAIVAATGCGLVSPGIASASASAASGSPAISSFSAGAAVAGWHLTPPDAFATAQRSPRIRHAVAGQRGLAVVVRAGVAGPGQWVITWSRAATLIVVAHVDDASGRIIAIGTGVQAQLSNFIPLAAWGGTTLFPGQTLTPAQVISLALRSPKLQAALRRQPSLVPAAWPTEVPHRWRIDWFRGGSDVVLAHFDSRTRTVSGVWTGRELAWPIGRGDPIYTGDSVGTWYVWTGFCLLFLLPFFDPKRPLRLLHFDLLALLAFSLSLVFFDHGNLSWSVPLLYPIFGYLFVRLLLAGLRPKRRPEKLVPLASGRILLGGILLLSAIRIVLNVTGSVPLDIGVASYTGGHQILHALSPYNGQLGQMVPGGDTYGPVTYLGYAPFALAFPNTAGIAFPGAHAAAIVYDLLTALGLVLLGLRLRPGRAGRLLGLALAYAWMAFPFTAFTLMESTNDALAACLLVFTLLFLASPARRGILLALAAMTKFFPLVLVPLIALGTGPSRRRTWSVFGAAFAGTALLTLLPFADSLSALHRFYNDTLGFQLHRATPLSIWGQVPGLRAVQRALEAATILLALGFGVFPRRRSHAQVAALCGCLIIAIEACASYWYYPYIVWFAPAAFVALFLQYDVAPVPRAALAPKTEAAALEPELAEAVV